MKQLLKVIGEQLGVAKLCYSQKDKSEPFTQSCNYSTNIQVFKFQLSLVLSLCPLLHLLWFQ